MPNGKRIRRYKRYRTPLEALLELPAAEAFLKPGVTAAALKSLAARQSDTDAAGTMQQARRKLFAELKRSA